MRGNIASQIFKTFLSLGIESSSVHPEISRLFFQKALTLRLLRILPRRREYSNLNNYKSVLLRKKKTSASTFPGVSCFLLPRFVFVNLGIYTRYSDQTCLMHETRISNFMRSNGPSTKIPAEDLRFPSRKTRQKTFEKDVLPYKFINIRLITR